MATKKPALITRYKTALSDLEKANNLIDLMRNDFAALEKKLANETSSKDTFYKNQKALEDEIEQLHCILDNVPNHVPRKSGADSDDSWNRKDLTISTRFGAWLANR